MLLPRLVTPASGLNVTVLVYPPATVAVTFNTTVTVPLTGMVTEPRTCVPTAVNAVGTLAPPTGVTLATLAVIPAGRLSTIDAVVKVLGPALPITMVKLVVPLTGIVVLPTVLDRRGVTCVVTVVPTVAVVEPRLTTPASGLNVTVLVRLPATVAVTWITTVTVPLTGMVTEPETLVPAMVNAVGTLAPPAGVATIPAALVVTPAGSVSTTLAVVITFGPALPITMV